MLFNTYAALALATGFAAAKPIVPRTPNINNVFGVNQFNGNGFNFIDGFNNFNNQQQVIQIQEQNLQVVNNGFQQQIVQQANEVLIINNQQNGFNNQLNNLFRKSNFRNQFQQQSTVVLVVQEIQVAVDNGFGGFVNQNIFAQSALVANRGFPATQTIMVFQQETLIARDVLGAVGGFQNFQNQFLNNNVNVGGSFPTRTADIQLFGSRPTWSAVAQDPAATLGSIWSSELQDAQSTDNNGNDNTINSQAAQIEAQSLEPVSQEGEQSQEEQSQEGEEAQEQSE